jgi:hypothetical protein
MSNREHRRLLAVRPELRARVRFTRSDLLTAALPGDDGFHVVACRNVLIYLQESVRNGVFGTLRRALLPGGLLFLGEAEWPDEALAGSLETLGPRRPHLSRPRGNARMSSRLDLSIGQRLGIGFALLIVVIAMLVAAIYQWNARSAAAESVFVHRIPPLTSATQALEQALLRVAIGILCSAKIGSMRS